MAGKRSRSNSRLKTLGEVLSTVADRRPRRRTLLALLGAGVAGGVVSNPGVAADLLQAARSIQGGDKSALDLVPPNDATHTAVQDGRWGAPSTWKNGAVPDDGARVLIPEDHTVRLASEPSARLEWVRVQGALSFDPTTDTQLLVDTIVTDPGSTLTIGTPGNPVRSDVNAHVRFIDRGPIDTGWDPDRVSRGLVAMGELSIYGAETTAWTALDRFPEAGDETLLLPESPENWQPGDDLVVPGLSPLENQDEAVRIDTVNGTAVTLDRPLEYDHVPPREAFDAYVLSLSRNVRFDSETTATRRRGHVMIHSTETDIRYATFAGLGRTDKSYPFTNGLHGTPPTDVEPNPKARYALHFHITGIGAAPHLVEGVVVNGSPGWGIVNHHSHVNARESITYDVFGAGFVAEAGDERGTFERNFALRSTGSGERLDSREFREDGEPGHVDDFGHGGHGFWLQGSQVALRANVAAGHRHHAFAFWNRSLLDRPLEGDEEIGDRADEVPTFPVAFVDGMERLIERTATNELVPASHLPLLAFEDNTAFACGGGLALTRHQFRWEHERFADYGTVDGFVAYGIGPLEDDDGDLIGPEWDDDHGGNQGILFRYSRNVRVRDAHLVSRGPGSGINRNEPYTRNIVVEGSTIEDWEVGIRASEDLMVLRENTLDNQIDVNVDKETLPRLLAVDNQYRPRRTANVRFEAVKREHLRIDELFWPGWDDGMLVDGRPAYFGEQAPDSVPVPTTHALRQLVEPGSETWNEVGERLGAEPRALIGKTNAELQEAFGIAAYGGLMAGDAELSPIVSGGRVAPANPTSASTVWLDAAQGEIGEIFQRGEDASAGNGSYIAVRGARSRGEPPTRSGISTYTVDVEPGAYEIYGRVWAKDGNSFWLRVDHGEWIAWDHLRAYRGWRWHAVPAPGDDVDGPRQFDLDGGTHTLKIGYRENRVRLDSLLVTAEGVPPIGRGLVPETTTR